MTEDAFEAICRSLSGYWSEVGCSVDELFTEIILDLGMKNTKQADEALEKLYRELRAVQSLKYVRIMIETRIL